MALFTGLHFDGHCHVSDIYVPLYARSTGESFTKSLQRVNLQLSGQVLPGSDKKRRYVAVNRPRTDDLGLFMSIVRIWRFGVSRCKRKLHFGSAGFTNFGARFAPLGSWKILIRCTFGFCKEHPLGNPGEIGINKEIKKIKNN